MVREIIHVQVGQCGNQMGNVFWNNIRQEHGLGPQGNFTDKDSKEKLGSKDSQQKLSKIDVYFSDAGNYRYVPRAVLVDLEPGTTDVIKASPMGKMFKPDNFVFGQNGANNNWAKGHYTDGAEMIDEVMEVVRKETESCDCPQGFQITHSLGGGTGSGLGTLLLMKIRDSYPDRITATFSVYPSPRVSDVVVEPYNAVLSIHQLLENSDETFVVDNEALNDIASDLLKIGLVKFSHLNWIISCVMCGITSSLRFSGKLNGDLRKMGVNLVPFPRLHFFAIAQAPLFSEKDKHYVNLNVQEVTDQMWSSDHCLAGIKPQDGKYLTASCLYRGNFATSEVDEEVMKIQQKKSDEFIHWIPNNILTSLINVAPLDTDKSGTFVGNTTSIKTVFQRISSQFTKLYKRKAFMHWYKGEGMDEMEFQEADKNVRDLITEYQDKEDAVVDEENDDDDDDNDEDDDDM